MLSTSLSQLLERARTRFGLEVEVLDSGLQHVYPSSSTALARLIEESPAVRQSLLDALADGRPEQLDGADGQYQVFPLRRPAKLRQATALVAVRRSDRAAAATEDEKAWPELARAIVEADFAAADALTDERQHSRRLLATLRFLRHLVETDVEADLGHAIVQAAAVWFDVDARIFQRDLAGDYVLHTALPGAEVEDSAKRLNAHWLQDAVEAVRLGSIPEWGQSTGGAEVVLVPLSITGSPDWVLALIGSFPADGEALFAVLGRIVGVQLETIRSRRRERTRERFESLVEQGGAIPELLAVRIVRELTDITAASSASLILNRQGRERRVVVIGTTPEPLGEPMDASGSWRFTPTEFVCTLPLGDEVFATLDLRAPAAEPFAPDAELVVRVAARVLQSWLAGAEPTLADLTRENVRPVVSEFIGRIEEELERAKRFDLRLSLVLIDIPGPVSAYGDATSVMKDAVRQELRGSDVLGTMSGDRVAALLTHTDGTGSHKVVGRLRRRLGEAAGRLNLAGVRVGHAAFSAECRTAEALLARAAQDAQPVGLQ
jgi:GGDEF domain-containing protein